MATPKSIFLLGLAKFKRRTLYANAVNDRTAVYYTTSISKTDPFTDPSKIKPNYVEGWEDVIMDPRNPVSPRTPKQELKTLASMTATWLRYVKNTPIAIFLVVFIPVGVTLFLINSVFQTFRSSRRIRLHDEGLLGINVAEYRVDTMLKDVRGGIEDLYENINSSQIQEYLAPSDEEGEDNELDEEERQVLKRERRMSSAGHPTLALEPCQFRMIDALDNLGWNKYPVWMHKNRHSHAAIIVRTEKPSFSEGHVVMNHWLSEEFEI